MKKKYVFVLVIFLSLFASLPSLWADINEYPSALGFYLGTIKGENLLGGLHYQHWFSNIGFQIEGGILFSPADKDLDYSIVSEILYSIYSNEYSNMTAGRLYLFGMLGHGGRNETNWNIININNENKIFRSSIFFGLGIGIEVISFHNFSFPFQIGYAADWPINFSEDNQPFIGLLVSSGIRYRF